MRTLYWWAWLRLFNLHWTLRHRREGWALALGWLVTTTAPGWQK